MKNFWIRDKTPFKRGSTTEQNSFSNSIVELFLLVTATEHSLVVHSHRLSLLSMFREVALKE